MRYIDTKKSLSIAVLISLLTGATALGQGSSASNSSVTQAGRGKKNTEINTQIGFDLKALSYSSTSPLDSSFQQKAELEVLLKKEGNFFAESDVIVGTFSEPQSFYYAFPNLYVGYGNKSERVIVGRKRENLSFLDSFYNFGLVQSHMTNDYINYVEGGLTGLIGEYSNGTFGVVASWNPLFIPNQGPSVKAEDGKVVSSNRWAPSPPSQFKFGDSNKDIVYAIRDYKIADIVMNSGYMASFFLGRKNDRPLLRVTYANKPINELALSRDTYADISNFQGYVYLSPVVLTHEVVAADINLDEGSFKSTLSLLTDKPENKTASDLEAIQTLSPLNIYSVYVAMDFSSTFGKKFEVYGSMAVVTGGEIKDLTRDGKESSFTFANSRTLYKKPVRVGLKSEMFFIYNEAVEGDMNLTYDQELKGSLISANVKYSPMKKLSVNLGADLVGVEDEQAAQDNFLSKNQANDRIFAGINYVF